MNNRFMQANGTDVLTAGKQRDILEVERKPPSLEADLVELERKLIPLLNRVRAMMDKPPVIVPRA